MWSSAHSRKQKALKSLFQIGLPLLLAAAILYWMYRGFDWDALSRALRSEMSWGWMWLSMPFGVSAQVFRALRWQQALRPLGQRTRLSTSVAAIFLSYASSLIVPRVGELLRCGVVKRYDHVDLGPAVGTVVTERVVDMIMVLLLTFLTVATQIPVFTHFLATTGLTLEGLLASFSPAGYAVTLGCLLVALLFVLFLARRLGLWGRARGLVHGLFEGLTSIRQVESKSLYLVYSVGIWLSYYLHFYLTFMCFAETESLGPVCALVCFVVGCFAVLVPTPNGAGPWHFAVKTVLVLYGVSASLATLFVLIVHTLQTLLVLLLGLVALLMVGLARRRGA